MHTNSFLPGRCGSLSKSAWVVLGCAILLSLAGILITYDYGRAYAGMFHWNYGTPLATQSVAVVLGMLSAWGLWRFRSEGRVSLLLLFWIGLLILWLPWTETFGYRLNGARQWIGFGSWFYFRADLVGLLLILPQWIRWAANDPRENVAGFLGKVRWRISPSAAFTLTLIAANGLLMLQHSPFGLCLINAIGLLLWLFGRLQRRWVIITGMVFAVLLTVLFGVLNRVHVHLGDRPFPESLAWPFEFTRHFHLKIAEHPLWGAGSALSAPYPRLPRDFDLRQSEFCEHIADIVRLRTGLPGVLAIGIVLASLGVALGRITRQPGTPEQRLRRIAFAAYLFLPMAGSAVRTLGDTWPLPAIPFPFLGFGFTVTTTAWIALGLLLREADVPVCPDNGQDQSLAPKPGIPWFWKGALLTAWVLLIGFLFTTEAFPRFYYAAMNEMQPRPPSHEPVAPVLENSLGMKFVSVATAQVLFSIWDTRVQDYQAFVDSTGREWKKPGFAQEPTHPAVNVSWEDAKAFCQWLTEKERKEKRIGEDLEYRLPTDEEWSLAVGLLQESQVTPFEKGENAMGITPWGFQWPPPSWAGNYGTKEDGFEYTSPVGSFRPNWNGLYDMGGNVFQLCEDNLTPGKDWIVVRGGAWNCVTRESMVTSYRGHRGHANGDESVGFRCVFSRGVNEQ